MCGCDRCGVLNSMLVRNDGCDKCDVAPGSDKYAATGCDRCRFL
jgi:hypothetical protein